VSEKFFIITDESPYHKEYMDYKQNIKDVNEFLKKFMVEHEIQTTEYAPNDTTLWIVPKGDDKEKLKSQLKANSYGELFAFKKNSVIGKAWISERKAVGLNVLQKPFVPFFFNNCCGHSRSNIFAIGETVYLQFEAEGEIDTPKGFTEIKGSEFYNVVEDYNAKQEEKL